MTTPTDNGDTAADMTTLEDPRHEELLRQAIRKKIAGMSREELRIWISRFLGLPLEEVIIVRPPEEKGDSKN
jgi:hypothetical protein